MKSLLRQFLVHHDFPLDEEENEERINRRNKDTVNKKGRVVSVFVILVFFLKIILNMYNHSFEKYILLHALQNCNVAHSMPVQNIPVLSIHSTTSHTASEIHISLTSFSANYSTNLKQ